jgi:hypothetical protein
LLASLFVVVTFPAVAQRNPGAEERARLNAYRQIMSDARTAAQYGEIEAAEAGLRALSPAARESALWEFDAALRLTQLAERLARAGDVDTARQLALRALQALAKAYQRTGETGLRASILNQDGLIRDRYLGDKPGARAAWRAAIQLLPASPTAREKQQQMDLNEATERRPAPGR